MLLNIVLSTGTGPSASCGYCCPLCPNGVWYPGKIRFIEPQGGNGSRRRAPGASTSGTPRDSQQTSESDRVGIVEGSFGNRARGVSIRVKFVLSRNKGVQNEGCRHVAKYTSDPREAYPKVKLQGRDLVQVVGIVVYFAPMGTGTRGKFV